MNESTAGVAPFAATVLAIAFGLAGPVLALAPLGMAPLVIAAALIATLAERIQHGHWPLPSARVILLAALFLTWCALTLLWALNPPSGARKLVDLIALSLAALPLFGLARRLSEVQRKRLAAILVGGTIVGLILLTIETGLDFPIYRAIKGDDPKLVDLLESKRSVDALPLLIWPAALGLWRLGRPALGMVLAALFTVGSVRLTAASSTFAMILSLAVLGLGFWQARLTRRMLALATAAAFVLIIPGAIAAYDSGGATAPIFQPLNGSHQFSARHRLEIWHFAAMKTLDRPLLGHGFNSSRYVPNDGAVSAFQPPDKPVITLHPHDAFLQIWLELGLVGAGLAAVILLQLVGGIARFPASAAPFAAAGYAAALVIAGLAFGIWQSWWIATLAFSAAASASIAGQGNHA